MKAHNLYWGWEPRLLQSVVVQFYVVRVEVTFGDEGLVRVAEL